MSSSVLPKAKQSNCGRFLTDHPNRLSATPQSALSDVQEGATTPLEVDITAPSPSTSEASTVFTDIDGGEQEETLDTEGGFAKSLEVGENKAAVASKSPSTSLTVQYERKLHIVGHQR